MRKISLLLLFPVLMATQCEDDAVCQNCTNTDYIIQNDSSETLFLLQESSSNISFIEIQTQSNERFASFFEDIDGEPKPPSESLNPNTIKLYKLVNDNYFIAYEQNPIDDSLWLLNESTVDTSTYENQYEYVFTITDVLLD